MFSPPSCGGVLYTLPSIQGKLTTDHGNIPRTWETLTMDHSNQFIEKIDSHTVAFTPPKSHMDPEKRAGASR